MPDNDKIAADAAKAEEAARKERIKARDEALKDGRKDSDADTDAFYERQAASKPTPTQDENDKAKLGHESLEELDNKEPDGSPEEEPAAPRGALEYRTRDASAGKTSKPAAPAADNS